MYEQRARAQYVMVSAFDGWNDACQSATNVVRHLVSKYRSLEVGHINRDGFYDFQTARPMQCTIQGTRRILWPQTSFYDITITDDLHILGQLGPEPNYHWMEYCQDSLHFAKQYGVSQVITLGSMFAESPHTRAFPVDISQNGESQDPDSEYSGPIGIPHVLDALALEDGYDTTALWISVPQYLGSDPCPPATLQLLNQLSMVIGVELDPKDLTNKAEQWKTRSDVMVHSNADLKQYVDQLEHDYDMKDSAKSITSKSAPEVQQLLQEAESYLRDLP